MSFTYIQYYNINKWLSHHPAVTLPLMRLHFLGVGASVYAGIRRTSFMELNNIRTKIQ